MVASLPVAALAVLQEARVHAVQSFINTLTGGLTGGAAPTAAGSVRVTGPFVNWAALAGYLLPIVLVSMATAIALGATSMSDIAVLAHLAPVLGEAPSGPTIRRALDLAGTPAVLDRIGGWVRAAIPVAASPNAVA